MKTETITYLNDAIEIMVECFKFNYQNADNAIQLFTTMINGGVGKGKSQSVVTVHDIMAEWMVSIGKIKLKNDYGLIYLDAPQLDATEVNGWFIPSEDKQSMTRLRPPHCPKDGYGIIFIDEMSQAPQSVQNVLGQLLLERRLGEHKLGEGWQIVVASNRQKDRAGTTHMPTQIRDRLKPWLNVDNSLEDIVLHFSKKNVNSKIISWMKFTQGKWIQDNAFNRDANSNPTPRSIEVCGTILDMKIKDHLKQNMLDGTIGVEASTDLIGFIKYYDRLPNIDEVIKDPMNSVMVEHGQLAYIMTTELSKRSNKNTFGNIADYMLRMYREQSSAELVALFVKECLARDGTLKTHPKMREMFGSNSPFQHLLK